MIKFNLDSGIKIGSKVVYIKKLQTFDGFHSIDTSQAIGTVIGINSLQYVLKFEDVSFFPKILQSAKQWYVRKDVIELL